LKDKERDSASGRPVKKRLKRTRMKASRPLGVCLLGSFTVEKDDARRKLSSRMDSSDRREVFNGWRMVDKAFKN
jgi:hypothetical protein